MPQPLPPTITGLSGGGENARRFSPICMSYVGAMAVTWTDLERELSHLLAIGMGSSERRAAGTYNTRLNGVARVAMEQAETIRMRLKLLDAMFRPLIEEAPLKEKWAILEKEIRARSKERNRIVHCRWQYTSQLPESLIEHTSKEQHLVWTEKDFRESIKRMHNLYLSINDFRNDLLRLLTERNQDVPQPTAAIYSLSSN